MTQHIDIDSETYIEMPSWHPDMLGYTITIDPPEGYPLELRFPTVEDAERFVTVLYQNAVTIAAERGIARRKAEPVPDVLYPDWGVAGTIGEHR